MTPDSYDFQYRTSTNGMKHNLNLSGAYRPVSGLRIALGNRVAYANKFVDDAKQIFLDRFVIDTIYDLPIPQVQTGFRANMTFISDSSGQVGCYVDGDSGDLGFSTNVDAAYVPTNPADGTSGMAMGAGRIVYIKKNLSNGYIQLGYQVQFNRYQSGSTAQAISHYIPLNIAFWF